MKARFQLLKERARNSVQLDPTGLGAYRSPSSGGEAASGAEPKRP